MSAGSDCADSSKGGRAAAKDGKRWLRRPGPLGERGQESGVRGQRVKSVAEGANAKPQAKAFRTETGPARDVPSFARSAVACGFAFASPATDFTL